MNIWFDWADEARWLLTQYDQECSCAPEREIDSEQPECLSCRIDHHLELFPGNKG